MSKPVQVDVVLSNSERLPITDVWLVIDILRASTVIVSWFAAGGSELYPAESVEAARALAERLRQEGKAPILMGEQNAIAPQGFDLGNSPLEITAELVQKNPCAVMATTNGTVAMLKAASTGVPVLVACARNAAAALEAALSKGRRIGILCSGLKGRPAWDDTLCAGLLVAYLAERFPEVSLADNARLARLVWAGSKDFKSSLKSADHAVFLEKIGYEDDVAFAGEINAAQVVPELHELPDGDGMRAVLRLAELDKPRYFGDRRLPGIEQPSSVPDAWQEDGMFRSQPHSQPGADVTDFDAENMFFAGKRHKKPHKSNLVTI